MQQPRKFNFEFEDLFRKRTWEEFFYRTPCVKTSYLWGIACGSIMMAHKWRLYRGALHHGFTAGILTFALVSGVSFVKCAHDVNERYEMMRKVYSAQNIKNNSKRIPESQPPPIL